MNLKEKTVIITGGAKGNGKATDKGITVNGISYGDCNTLMNSNWIDNEDIVNSTLKKIPLKWIAEPEEIARFTAVILKEFSDYATGSIFNIDGGRDLTY